MSSLARGHFWASHSGGKRWALSQTLLTTAWREASGSQQGGVLLQCREMEAGARRGRESNTPRSPALSLWPHWSHCSINAPTARPSNCHTASQSSPQRSALSLATPALSVFAQQLRKDLPEPPPAPALLETTSLITLHPLALPSYVTGGVSGSLECELQEDVHLLLFCSPVHPPTTYGARATVCFGVRGPRGLRVCCPHQCDGERGLETLCSSAGQDRAGSRFSFFRSRNKSSTTCLVCCLCYKCLWTVGWCWRVVH